MATVGRLRTVETKSGPQLEGSIATLQLSISLVGRFTTAKRSPNEPDIELYAISADGVEVRIGAGWKKTAQAKGNKGEEFYSITLDDPSFPTSLNIAAFKGDEPGTYVLAWRRRQDRSGKAA